jgi:cyanate permease
MVATPVLFLGVVRSLDEPIQFEKEPTGLLLSLAVGVVALGLALARIVPPRLPVRQAGGRAHVAVLTRFVLGWSICEAVALFPLVGYLLTRDLRLLAPAVVALLALVLWYPSRARWTAALPDEPPADRMVH